ncbi:MAG: energy transducer TonB [Kiritimatiellae bacterium]|nr:energy transducer TonB [Kiritimatiellia bacterium]
MSGARPSWCRRALGAVLRAVGTVAVAAGLTLVVFLVLPLIQRIAHPPAAEMELRPVTTAALPPPPAPPPPEPEPEKPEEEPPPPELDAPAPPPMDLAALEMALDPGLGGGGAVLDIGARLLSTLEQRAKEEGEAVFSVADLDQVPRPVHQPAPEYPTELKRKRIEGTVHVVFLVDPSGAVQNPTVVQSVHPALDRAALQSVRKWRFDPGRRGGQPVAFRMKVPITFALR